MAGPGKDQSKSKPQLIRELEDLRVKDAALEETERKHQQIEMELHRVNRALATVSACHKVLVRSKDKAELFQNICRVIVDVGGYRMAWAGIAHKDKVKSIRPLGTAGAVDGYLESIKTTWSDGRNGTCPAGRAIVSGRPFVVKNILTDPEVMTWRGEALKHGFASVVSLPLVSKSATFGALSIYSGETEMFHDDEVELLMEIADNLVYGLLALHTRTERFRAESEVKSSLDRLRKALGAIIQVLEQTVEIRDPYTAGHQRRVADLARHIAEEMNLSNDRIDGIRIAGIIHDIGKIYVPAEILSKPRRLSQIEFNLIKTHSQVGYDVLKAIDFPWPVARIILQHHERIDGSGYPHNLSGDEIMLEAKILGVADVVEAMASHRPYRPALGVDAALQEIEQNKGVLYEPQVVDACLRVFRERNFKFKDVSLEF
jgi:putative nucleotidyltransferase with HDIG domain